MKVNFVRSDKVEVSLRNRPFFSFGGNKAKAMKAKLKITRSKKQIRHAGQRRGGGNSK